MKKDENDSMGCGRCERRRSSGSNSRVALVPVRDNLHLEVSIVVKVVENGHSWLDGIDSNV